MAEGIRTYDEKRRDAQNRASRNRRRGLIGAVTAAGISVATIMGINAISRPVSPDFGNSNQETIRTANELIFDNALIPDMLVRQIEVDLAKVNIREGTPEIDNGDDSDDPNIINSNQIVEANGVSVDTDKQVVRIGNATLVQGESSNSPIGKEPYLALIVKVREPLTGFTDLKRAFINISDNTSTGVKIDTEMPFAIIRGDNTSGFSATSASGNVIKESEMNIVTIFPRPSESTDSANT